jgi:hypothetical protein
MVVYLVYKKIHVQQKVELFAGDAWSIVFSNVGVSK